jgi:hypothetical protein
MSELMGDQSPAIGRARRILVMTEYNMATHRECLRADGMSRVGGEVVDVHAYAAEVSAEAGTGFGLHRCVEWTPGRPQ